MGIISHRTIQKLNLAAVLRQFIHQQHLVHILASESIGCGDQDQFKGGHRCLVAQPVEAGPIQRGTAVAVIAVDMFF